MPEFDSTLEFRPVDGFPGYCVGNDGSVWSCRDWQGTANRPWHQLQPTLVSRGTRPQVKLCYGHKTNKQVRVHTLVLTAFRGPCPPGMECRHLDGVATNNQLSNLCWGTKLENADDRKRHGQYPVGEGSPSAKLTARKVRNIRRSAAAGRDFHVIAKQHGVTWACIRAIVKRITWKHIS